MRCLRCSHELKLGELICPQCGAKAIEDKSSTATLPEESRFRRKPSTDRSGPDGPLLDSIVMQIRGLQKRLSLPEISNMIIGRADAANSYIPDFDLSLYGAEQRGVSRQHIRLHYADGALTVTDLNSANGTRLNGQKLTPGEPYPIKDGDELVLGQLSIAITYSH